MSLALRTRTPAAALLLAPTCEARWGALRREAVKTPSPNSGWPMAAMALDIHLAKPGVSMLNPDGGTPLPAQTGQSVVYVRKVLLALMSVALVAIFFRVMILL